MKMTFRWYGRESDPIPLKYVKQIPGMSGLMGLLDKPAGVDWPEEEVKALVEEVHAAGLELEVVESVNVHEDIKMGLPTRDEYIANYISTIRTLAKYGVKVIIYNFMPVFDWLRTDLARVIPMTRHGRFSGCRALRIVRRISTRLLSSMTAPRTPSASAPALWAARRTTTFRPSSATSAR